MNAQAGGNSKAGGIANWDAREYLKELDAQFVRYSRGFLRCRPERWFPGFAAHWLPLGHSLGVEFKCQEVKPTLELPADFSNGFVASIDDEPLAIVFDAESAQLLSSGLTPGANAIARKVGLEYIARRILGSLNMSWSGSENSAVQFESDMDPRTIRPVAAVKLVFVIDNKPCTAWFLLGKLAVERFDGLWRKQINANQRAKDEQSQLDIELGFLTLPPTMLGGYLKPGTEIDLETPVSNNVNFLLNGDPWCEGLLLRTAENFVISVAADEELSNESPEGTVRFSVVLGGVKVNQGLLNEIAQPGAYLDTKLALGDQVQLMVRGEVVGTARLKVYEHRLAIKVD